MHENSRGEIVVVFLVTAAKCSKSRSNAFKPQQNIVSWSPYKVQFLGVSQAHCAREQTLYDAIILSRSWRESSTTTFLIRLSCGFSPFVYCTYFFLNEFLSSNLRLGPRSSVTHRAIGRAIMLLVKQDEHFLRHERIYIYIYRTIDRALLDYNILSARESLEQNHIMPKGPQSI